MVGRGVVVTLPVDRFVDELIQIGGWGQFCRHIRGVGAENSQHRVWEYVRNNIRKTRCREVGQFNAKIRSRRDLQGN